MRLSYKCKVNAYKAALQPRALVGSATLIDYRGRGLIARTGV